MRTERISALLRTDLAIVSGFSPAKARPIRMYDSPRSVENGCYLLGVFIITYELCNTLHILLIFISTNLKIVVYLY